MLKTLYVKNFAIIDELILSFNQNFTVITGETGAGKSILVNAILLLTGIKANTSFLKNKNDKSIIEAIFTANINNFEELFKEHNIDLQNEIIIRREILPSGTTRQYINDCIVNVGLLKETTLKLIDIHSQYHNILLKQQSFQLQIIDTQANLEKELTSYKQQFLLYKEYLRQLKVLTEKQEEEKKNVDFWLFQQKEFEILQWTPVEFHELEQEFQSLEHAEEILEKLSSLYAILYQNESSVLHQLKVSEKILIDLINKFPRAKSWIDSIRSTIEEIKEISKEIISSHENIQANPEKYQTLQNQLDAIYKLQHKYRKSSYEELLELKAEINEKLSHFSTSDEQIHLLNQKIQVLKQHLIHAAESMHSKRYKISQAIQKPILQKLQSLGMPHATIEIQLTKLEELTENGITSLQLFFSANPKFSPQPLDKIASGGELSRLLLTLKSLNTSVNFPKTILLDEADSGISGEIAFKAGKIMKELAITKQVIAITHLPQVAACANHHIAVQKSTENDETRVTISYLNNEQRITEIAKLLSSDQITLAALEQASYLLSGASDT